MINFSPLGEIEIKATARGIYSVALLCRQRKNISSTPRSDFENEAALQLAEYFNGIRQEFNLPLDLVGTDFQKRVWLALLKINFGQIVTYKKLACLAGFAGAAQAVGQAVKSNPVALVIPCHRVVPATQDQKDFGNYAWGRKKKIWLLTHEQFVLRKSQNIVAPRLDEVIKSA